MNLHSDRLPTGRLIVGVFLLLFASVTLVAQPTDLWRFSSRALKDGIPVYDERHEAEYRNGRIFRSRTDYLSPEGTPLAYIESFFAESLTAPSHVFVDYRTGFTHGTRYVNGLPVLFAQEKGKAERSRVLTERSDGRALMVGSQGLFYYLQEDFDQVRKQRKIPVRLLITGPLDVYDFELEYLGEKDGVADLVLHISNPFLRLFAPKLEVRYDAVNRKMLYYRGLSNILDDRGKLQTVEIVYAY